MHHDGMPAARSCPCFDSGWHPQRGKGLCSNRDVSPIDLVLYDLARDIAQGFGIFPHSNRCSGVCFCASHFYS